MRFYTSLICFTDSNKARKETIWHGKQILTKNVSTSTIKPYRRNHDATTTTGSHQTKYGSDSGSTFSRNEFPNDMTTSFDVTTLSIENEHERRIRYDEWERNHIQYINNNP